MPISMLLLKDSRAILYLLEFAKSDVIGSQPHSKLRLQTHIVLSKQFLDGLLLGKISGTMVQFYTQVKAEESTRPIFLQSCVQSHWYRPNAACYWYKKKVEMPSTSSTGLQVLSQDWLPTWCLWRVHAYLIPLCTKSHCFYRSFLMKAQYS